MNNAMLEQLVAECAGRTRTTERVHTGETVKTTQNRSVPVEGLPAAMAAPAQDRCQKRPKFDGTDGKETISNADVIDLCASDSDVDPVEVEQTRRRPLLCCKDNDAASLALASRLLEDDSLSLI